METNEVKRPLGWTTLEEAQKLIEAGLDPETADMYYVKLGANEYSLRPFSEPNWDRQQGVDKPCWSLGALFRLIPNHFKFKTFIREISGDQITFAFWCQAIETPEFTGTTDIELACKLIVWLLKEGYLNPKS